jgi:hypothetical protein
MVISDFTPNPNGKSEIEIFFLKKKLYTKVMEVQRGKIKFQK